MNIITVCKNVIASNNKKNWIDPDPVIRVSETKSGQAIGRSNYLEIMDHWGMPVAWIEVTTDGKPIVKCGAKVAIKTLYPVQFEKSL